MADREEVNEDPKIDLKLERDPQCDYRYLVCRVCESGFEFSTTLSDNGQWGIECTACHETAEILSNLINTLR